MRSCSLTIMRNSFDDMGTDDVAFDAFGEDAVASVILAPVLRDGEDARRRLQAFNNGAVTLSEEEQLHLLVRMTNAMDMAAMGALLVNPDTYRRHFLG